MVNKKYYINCIIRDLFNTELASFFINGNYINYKKLHKDFLRFFKKFNLYEADEIFTFYLSNANNLILQSNLKDIIQLSGYRSLVASTYKILKNPKI